MPPLGLAAGGPPPGDPAALEAGARTYAATADALKQTGAELRAVAFGLVGTPDWSGQASAAFLASAVDLVQTADRGAAALRDGAGALRAYATALQQAQTAWAQADTDHAAAVAEQTAARRAVAAVPADRQIPVELFARLDSAEVALATATAARLAATEAAHRAAQTAAAAFREVAAQANPAPKRATRAEGKDGDDGLFGWLGDAAGWALEQFIDFNRGIIEGFQGLVGGLWMLVKLGPVYFAIDPQGSIRQGKQLGAALTFAVDHPKEFARAAANWEDLAAGRYAEWAGNLVPGALITAATWGGGAAISASTRSLGAARALAGMRHTLRDINPGFRKVPGRDINCMNCTAAVDATLDGRPATALPWTQNQPLSVFERQFGGKFEMMGRDPDVARSNIEQYLTEAGPGARGIVYGDRGQVSGHVFNAVNQNGVVKFLDGQTGTEADFYDPTYEYFKFLPTN